MKFIIMKKTFFFKTSIVFAALLLLSSCGLDLMVSKFNTLEYTVTPTQVEVHGGVIDIELDVVAFLLMIVALTLFIGSTWFFLGIAENAIAPTAPLMET